MAVYDLEEQEQLAELKAWWATYGNTIVGAVLAVVVAVVGVLGWKSYQRSDSAEAAALYAVVQNAVSQHDAAGARQAAGQILEKYSSSAYASMAAMLSAKAQADAGDWANAALALEWVMANADLPAMQDIARLRLAAVKLDAGELDAAQSLLAQAPGESLTVRHQDLLGDVLAAAGKIDEARAAYDKALEAAAVNAVAGDRSAEIIRLKRDALPGGAK